jgi:stage V sporulation protein R
LRFVAEHSKHLEEWERNLILIVEESSKYFIPQALTKVMNEGWACTIHYKIVNELNLPDSLHLPFIKLHNQVVRPHLGQLNPYHLGFKLFEKIIEEGGMEEAMIVRECHNDISFLRFYLDEEFMQENNYFSYSFKKDKKAITIDDISDEGGWESVRDQMIQNIGLNRVPVVYIDEIEKNNTLSLIHEHDGRDLDLTYATKVFGHIRTLWGDEIRLISMVENEIWEF